MNHTALRVCSVLALAAAGLAVTASTGTAHATAPAASRHVIVVLESQSRVSPSAGESRAAQRSAYAANRQAGVEVAANARADGASNIHTYGLIAGFSATMSDSAVAALSHNPAVARVYPDLKISMGPSLKRQVATSARSAKRAAPDTAISGPTCPADPAHPLLTPEALGVTNTAFSDTSRPQAQNIVDGTGVKVAFIADGLDINNQDFVRSGGEHVFIDYKDFSGDGPNAETGGAEAFGDASAIAAQGLHSYDLSNYVSPDYPVPVGCNITVRGMAPGVSLIGLKVFGNSNFAPTSNFIDAIDYAVSDGANVLNESFGGNPFPDNDNDPITLADHAAIAAGTTVVASTGDAGTTGTVGSPATDPKVIGVAASTTLQSYAQDTEAGFQLSNGSWLNNNISGLSSGGTTQLARTPDLVAPGDSNWALCSTDVTTYTECTNDSGSPSPIQNFGGTSQSSPLTAGAAALVIEAYQNTHGGVKPAPALVKRFLTSTATDLGHPAYEQGSGLLNSLGAVQAAESWKDKNGSPSAVGRNLVVDQTQLSAVGRPNHVVTKKVSVTNVSSQRVTVKASARQLGKPKTVSSGKVTLNTNTASTYTDNFGIVRSYVQKKFTVPAGHDRLTATIAVPLPDGFAPRIILLDPSGAYAAYSLPQGAGNWATIDVRKPAHGTWTAILAASQSSAYNGPITFGATVSDYTKASATLSSPSFSLAPGASKTEVVHVREPKQPGDVSASVQFKETGGPTTSVPLTERAVIGPSGGTFTDTIEGGNGRGALAQSKFYYLDVPKHAKSANIGIKLSDPGQLVLATLSDPSGQVASYQSNTLVKGSNANLTHSMQFNQQHPKAGRWVLGIGVQTPASGKELSAPFTVKTSYGAAKVQAKLPNSKKTKLKAGKRVTVPVKVKNTGTTTAYYFADPRLTKTGTVTLAEQSGVPQPFALPQADDVSPNWLTPTQCTTLNAKAVADQPVNLDFYFESGEPDLYGSANGNSASAKVKAGQVSPGPWFADVGQVGPFSAPATPGSVSVSASAHCQLFDTTFGTSTLDFWTVGVGSQSPSRSALHAASLERFSVGHGLVRGKASAKAPLPFLKLAPGKSGKILVQITPQGGHGKVVKGHVYVDTVDLFTGAGNEISALPYTYTIK